ncbi:MAG: transposase [Candidatus Limiplasma sp.]|nr:transposase [Candidatus Limiplasma sp.]
MQDGSCVSCERSASCFDNAGLRRRILASSCYPAFFRDHERIGSSKYLSMMRKRKVWSEGSFSVLKREHLMSKIRKWGILNAAEECLLAAAALNLKRMAKAIPALFCQWKNLVVWFVSLEILPFFNRSYSGHYLLCVPATE